MRSTLYQSIDVWRRLGDGRLACYRCFRLLPDGGYCVQSLDFLSPGADLEAQDRRHRERFLEALTEEAPEDRAEVHATLEAAIEAHDREFAWAGAPGG